MKRKEGDDGQHDSCNNGSNKPLLFTAKGDAIYDSETPSHTEDRDEEPKQSLLKRGWRSVRRKDSSFWQAIFTALTFGGLLAYTYYTRNQWLTLENSVKSASESFEKTLHQMQAQTTAQQTTAQAAESAANTAKSTLTLSNQQFNASQRPYLTIESVRLNGDLTDGKMFAIDLTVKNTGRTAAILSRPCQQIMYTAKQLNDVMFSPNRLRKK